jgi:hypothetical protein
MDLGMAGAAIARFCIYFTEPAAFTLAIPGAAETSGERRMEAIKTKGEVKNSMVKVQGALRGVNGEGRGI